MRQFFVFILYVITSASLFAQTKADGDSAYAKGEMAKAVRIYNQVLQRGEDASVYYNLGNAYYRLNDIAHSVLAYERALLREPGDKDIRFNLALVRSKTVDNIPEESEMFFISWTRAFMSSLSADSWAVYSVFALSTTLFLFMLYLLLKSPFQRKLGFFGAAFMLVLTVLFFVFSKIQSGHLSDNDEAVVMTTASVRSTPGDDGTVLFLLHGGTKVKMTDNSMKNWREVSLSDGKKGWIKKNEIEIIQ